MLVRRLTCLAILALAAAPLPAPAAEDAKAPALVVRMKSLNGVLEDLMYLAELAGAGEQAKQGKALLPIVLGDKGAERIDPTRPLGLYGSMSDVITDSSAVFLIPVTSEQTFVSLLTQFNVTAKKGKDDIYTLTTDAFPLPVPIYLRVANKYAYITALNESALAKDNLLDPAKILSAGEREATLSATFHLDRIPEGLKKIAVENLDLRMAEEREKKQPGETEAQRAVRQELIKGFSRKAAGLVNDGGKLDITLNVDKKGNQIVAELSLAGKPSSQLATGIADLGKAKSLFAGMTGANAALSIRAHAVLPEDIRQSLGKVIDENFQKAHKDEKDENRRALSEKVFKAIAPTLNAGELDAALLLLGPDQDQHYTAVFGIKLKDGLAILQAGRELFKAIPPGEREKIKLDAETAGDVKIHRMDIQDLFNRIEGARDILGDNPLYVAVTADRELIAVGPGGLKALKAALAAQPATGPLFQLDVSPTQLPKALLEAVPAQGDNPNAANLRKALKEAAGQKLDDQIRITVEGGTTLKARVTMKTSMVKILGKLAPRPGRPGN